MANGEARHLFIARHLLADANSFKMMMAKLLFDSRGEGHICKQWQQMISLH
jgi:hypothetical protein